MKTLNRLRLGPRPLASPEGSSSSGLIDWPSMLQRCMGDAGLAGELCDIFVQETPRLRAILTEALAAANSSDVEYAAHTLKGMAGNVSAAAARAAALELELAARKGEPVVRLQAMAEEVALRFDGVMEALSNRERDGGPP